MLDIRSAHSPDDVSLDAVIENRESGGWAEFRNPKWTGGNSEFRIQNSEFCDVLLPLYASAKENDVKFRVRYIVMCTCLVALAAGYAWAKVNFEYDHSVDFSSYSTYAWMERDNSVEAQLPEHLLIRLRRVSEDVLAEKGFDPAPAPPQTDLLLTFYFSDKDELQINQVAYSPYSPWG